MASTILNAVKFEPIDSVTLKNTFDDPVKQALIITNPTDSTIAFRCKGTSPEIIQQKPHCGYIKPKDKVTVEITVASLANYAKLPKTQRVTTLLIVAPADKQPADVMQLWKDEALVKESRRQALKLKFKRKKGKKGAKDKKAEKETEKEADEEESEEGSGSDEEGGEE